MISSFLLYRPGSSLKRRCSSAIPPACFTWQRETCHNYLLSTASLTKTMMQMKHQKCIAVRKIEFTLFKKACLTKITWKSVFSQTMIFAVSPMFLNLFNYCSDDSSSISSRAKYLKTVKYFPRFITLIHTGRSSRYNVVADSTVTPNPQTGFEVHLLQKKTEPYDDVYRWSIRNALLFVK